MNTSRYFELLINAHEVAATRDNVSTHILLEAYHANGGDMIKSITAAMMTLGGLHGPIKQVYRILTRMRQGFDVQLAIEHMGSCKIPGFGSSFYKGTPDPSLHELAREILGTEYASMCVTISEYLAMQGKVLYPNISFYTGVAAMIEGVNPRLCEKYLILSRLGAWIRLLEKTYGSQGTDKNIRA